MPTRAELEADLAELDRLEALQADIDDDDPDGEGDGGTGGAGAGDSKSIKAIRAAERRKSADLKAERTKNAELQARLDEADAFRTALEEDRRSKEAAAVFKALGLREKTANLYKGEPDEAAVKQWAIDNDLISADGEELSSDVGDGFEPSQQGGGNPPAGPRKLGHAEAVELLKTDPALYVKMFDAGRITLNKSNYPGEEPVA